MALLTVAYIGSNPNSVRNLTHGLKTRTWAAPNGAPTLDPESEYLLLVNHFSLGSPRVSLEQFLTGNVDAVLCEITTKPYKGEAPHWGDEISRNLVLYPQRFGIEPLADIAHLALTDSSLPSGTADAIRRSGIQRGFLMTVPTTREEVNALLVRAGLDPQQPFTKAPGVTLLSEQVNIRQARGAGRLNDQARRKATERYAVQRAIEYLTTLGYKNIQELGAPYDLEAQYGEDLIHIEVKGSTGAGGVVELTRNEVNHHRHRDGGMLVVVSDIIYDSETVTCRGGKLTAFHNWQIKDEDLVATRFEYRVPRNPNYQE